MKKFNSKNFYLKYKHAIPLLVYAIIYLSWFIYIEKKITSNYQVIHVALDDHIPFLEIFVIPYFLWFAYVAAAVLYLFFKEKDNYTRACVFIFTGMTIFLIISTLFPNGQHLRPRIMPRENIFTYLIAYLYRTDTPTNLWPSIHVYNSLGAHFAIVKSSYFKDKKWVKKGSLLLSLSIILSTVFIKQHSVFDVVTAFILAVVMYGIVYKYDIVMAYKNRSHARKKATPQVN